MPDCKQWKFHRELRKYWQLNIEIHVVKLKKNG